MMKATLFPSKEMKSCKSAFCHVKAHVSWNYGNKIYVDISTALNIWTGY